VLGEPENDFWGRAGVGFEVVLCPSCEGDAGVEGVEGQAAFVVAGCAGVGEEGCGDEATGGL